MDKAIRFCCVLLLCASWFWGVRDWMSSRALFVVPWALLLVGILVEVLLRIGGREIAVPRWIRILGTVTLCWWLVCQWALLYGLWTVQQSWPRELRVASIAASTAVQTLLVSCAFAYPLLVAYPRRYWVVTLVAAALVVIIKFHDGLPSKPVSILLHVWELACLSILVPLGVRLLEPRLKLKRAGGPTASADHG